MTRCPRRRGLLAAAVTALAMSAPASLVAAAQAAPPPTPPPGGFMVTDLGDRPAIRAPRAAARRPAAAAARTPTASRLTALITPCPRGTRFQRTLLWESFERGSLPEPTGSTGWSVTTGGDAAGGSRYASSRLAPAASPPYHVLLLPVLSTGTGRTIVRLDIRGDYPAETAFISANGVGGWVRPSTSWGRIRLDLTAAVAAARGELDLRVFNYPATLSGSIRVDVDNIEIYRCEQIPATGVRGDLTGDGRADAVVVDGLGVAWIRPGRRDATLGPPVRIGPGWGQLTWLASAGDVTGDRRGDLIGRRGDGVLVRYAGQGGEWFASPVTLGRGWRTMTALVLPGDVNGDRIPDVIARTRDGRLYRYGLRGNGTVSAGVAMGSGFAGMRLLGAAGDLTGDRRADLLAVTADGRLRVYPGRAGGGLAPGRVIGSGWRGAQALAAPGDVNGDRREDLLARFSDGSIRLYLGGNGRLGGGRPVISAGSGSRLVG